MNSAVVQPRHGLTNNGAVVIARPNSHALAFRFAVLSTFDRERDDATAIHAAFCHAPTATTDGRGIVLTRYTRPEADLQPLIDRLRLTMPAQPLPKITATMR
jgi:hypothetical protein